MDKVLMPWIQGEVNGSDIAKEFFTHLDPKVDIETENCLIWKCILPLEV